MRISLTYRLLLLVLVAAVAVVVVSLSLGLTKQEVVPVIAAAGTTVSAIVAAIAAGQSREATNEVRLAADRASEGLSRTIIPEIQVMVTAETGADPMVVRGAIFAMGRGASSVTIDWYRANGSRLRRDTAEEIPANRPVETDIISMKLTERPISQIAGEVASVVVEFEDARGIQRWREELNFPEYQIGNEEKAIAQKLPRAQFFSANMEWSEVTPVRRGSATS